MTAKLDPAKLPGLLSQLPSWSLDADAAAISRHLEFADFNEAFAFMARVALMAERKDHHPDWSNAYNKVEVTWTTHDAGGLTELDIALARVCDAAFERRGRTAKK